MALTREQLNQIYISELGRLPKEEGVNYWLGGGTTLTNPENVRRAVSQSSEAAEFRASQQEPQEPPAFDPNEPMYIQPVMVPPSAFGLGSFIGGGGDSRTPAEDIPPPPQQTALTAEQVRQAYLDLLDRTPSPQGLEYWTGIDLDPNIDYQDSPTSITTVEGLRQAIMEGPEYQAKLTGDTTTKQIQETYREQLGRDPTIADYEYWTGLDFDKDIAASDAPTTLKEINQIQQAISESPEFQERVEQGLEEPFQPTAPTGQPGQMAPFSYTDFPGGIFGPGQAMPNIFVPAGQEPAGMTPMPTTPAPAPGTAAPGPRTMVSPGITTYAYPQPFGNIDIFSRPGAQTPVNPMGPINPNEVVYQGGPGPRPTMPSMPNIPSQSPTNTTTQQNMGQGMANLSPAQRALLGNIFG